MSRANLLLVLLLVVAATLNLVGAFSPEIGFDALWYHLTIPKLYLEQGRIFHIPGGLLYYSELPRLTEVLYLPLLKYFGDVGPHLLSWTTGFATAIIIYKLARKLGLSSFFSLLSSIVFYVTPLVGWLSGSAYIDLARTFFEALALYLVLSRKFIASGLALGLAISTKTLALGSLLPLITVSYLITRNSRHVLLFLVSCIPVIIPWFLSAYLNTGYPFYPIGAGILDSRHSLNLDVWNLPKFFGDFWKLWLFPEDPISPIYLIILPFLILNIRKLWSRYLLLIVYCTLSYFLWYVTPRTGGGRFILPYLPGWAVLVGAVVAVQREQIKKILIATIIFISVINLVYRGLATAKILSFLFGRQTKTEYLCKNLDTKVTFVDCDGWFARNLRPTDLVLVTGYHSLYYIDFPFVHESWYRGEGYDYVVEP